MNAALVHDYAAEAVKRTVRLIKITAALHKNCGWKYKWQSAFWAANLAHAAWFLWEELDGETRKDIEAMAHQQRSHDHPYFPVGWRHRTELCGEVVENQAATPYTYRNFTT